MAIRSEFPSFLLVVTDIHTDIRTDIRTDKAVYRVADSRLKRENEEETGLTKSFSLYLRIEILLCFIYVS